MSEVRRYECTVLIDASCGVTVEASSPEEAAELAENAAAEQGAGSLCHQCSGHTECGDSYAVIVYGEDGQEVLDTDYRSGQLKAAQSELAALREELATANNRLHEVATLCATVEQRLAAAEQRNAEFRELLRLMTVEYACCLESGYDRITMLGGDCDRVAKMLEDNPNYAKAIAALAKPTESGASE